MTACLHEVTARRGDGTRWCMVCSEDLPESRGLRFVEPTRGASYTCACGRVYTDLEEHRRCLESGHRPMPNKIATGTITADKISAGPYDSKVLTVEEVGEIVRLLREAQATLSAVRKSVDEQFRVEFGYRDLLRKYMRHVTAFTGDTFLAENDVAVGRFSQIEWTVLREIAKEVTRG